MAAFESNRKIQYLAGICASLAFTFTGATLSWSSPSIPKFKSGEANVVITDGQCSWLVSLHGLGALAGCYVGQLLHENLGHRRTFFSFSVPAVLGASLIMLTKVPEIMYVARFLMGIATGITAVVTMIYVTEISDKEIRGSLGMVVQVMNYLGSLTVYSVGPFVSYTVLNSIILSLPIIFLLVCLWIPESPYYHLKHERLEAAKKEFMRLRGTTDEKWVDDQLAVMRAHVRESMENKTTLKELLTNMRYRKAVYIVFGLKLLQYMTGILVIQSYLEVIFRQSSSISGPIASIVYGFVQLSAGLFATLLPRRFGRRALMFTSCFGVSIAMTMVGAYFYIQDSGRASQETLAKLSPLPLAGIFGFNVLYAFGIGNIPYIMQAELFPVNVKSVASSTATMLACILSFVVTKFYQNVKDIFGHYVVFWVFAAVGYASLFFIYFCVPETNNQTLEEVQDKIQEVRPEEAPLRAEIVDEEKA